MEKSNEGIWIKYNKKEGKKLVKSIENKKTGWCIEKDEAAKICLNYRDIEIFYTKDENGNYTVPRLAVISTSKYISTIMGIKEDELVELELVEAIEEKIKTLPDKEKYQKKLENIKKLQLIKQKTDKDIKLTIEELEFLYELKEKIKTLGFGKEPLIEEIKEKRNPKKDLSRVFKCPQEYIGIKESDLKEKNLLVYYGDIETDDITEYKIPNIVVGNLNLKNLRDTKGLQRLRVVYGNLDLSSIKESDYLYNIQEVIGNTDFRSLEDASNMTNFTYIKGRAYFVSLKSPKGLENLNIEGMGSILPEKLKTK